MQIWPSRLAAAFAELRRTQESWVLYKLYKENWLYKQLLLPHSMLYLAQKNDTQINMFIYQVRSNCISLTTSLQSQVANNVVINFNVVINYKKIQ
jgi:hypothetical protein